MRTVLKGIWTGTCGALQCGTCGLKVVRCPLQIFSWDVKTPGYNVLLASLQPGNMQAMSAANAFFQAYIPGSQRTVPHTANGLAYPWHGAGARAVQQGTWVCRLGTGTDR